MTLKINSPLKRLSFIIKQLLSGKVNRLDGEIIIPASFRLQNLTIMTSQNGFYWILKICILSVQNFVPVFLLIIFSPCQGAINMLIALKQT